MSDRSRNGVIVPCHLAPDKFDQARRERNVDLREGLGHRDAPWKVGGRWPPSGTLAMHRQAPSEPRVVPGEQVALLVDDFLGTCIENGMQPPLIVCMVSPAGTVMAFRHRPEAQWEFLVDRPAGIDDARTVVNVTVLDQVGETAQLRLIADDEPAWH
jgi:hypothetical protein